MAVQNDIHLTAQREHLKCNHISSGSTRLQKWHAFIDPFWRKNVHQNQTKSTYMFNIIYIKKVWRGKIL